MTADETSELRRLTVEDAQAEAVQAQRAAGVARGVAIFTAAVARAGIVVPPPVDDDPPAAA